MKNHHFSNAVHFHSLGLNITCLTGEGEIFYFPFPQPINHYPEKDVQTKIRFKSPSHPFESFQNNRQTLSDLEKLDWEYSHGIGVVLGYGDIAVIDIDNSSNDALAYQLLEKLNFPKNYEWLVRTGLGYHIYFRPIDYSWEWSKQDHTYLPQGDYEDIFGRIELKFSQGHSILPNSKHLSGKNYKFLNTHLPNHLPSQITMETLMRAISELCDFSKIPLYEDSSHYYFHRASQYESFTMTQGPFFLVLGIVTNGSSITTILPTTQVEDYPKIQQIAWQLYDYSFSLVKEKSFTITCENQSKESLSIYPSAPSETKLESAESQINEALISFSYDLATNCTVICHDIKFSLDVIHAEMARNNINSETFIGQWISGPVDFSKLKTFCTMENTATFVGLKTPNGFKNPTLLELYQKLFVKKFVNEHDALELVKATAVSIRELISKYGFDIKSEENI